MSSDYSTASEGRRGGRHAYLKGSSEGSSTETNATSPETEDLKSQPPHRRGRVRFNSTSETNDAANKRSSLPLRAGAIDLSLPAITPPRETRTSPAHSRNSSITNPLRRYSEKEKTSPLTEAGASTVLKPQPSVLRSNSTSFADALDDAQDFNDKRFSALAAQERAQRVASLVGNHSAATSRRSSYDNEEGFLLHPTTRSSGLPVSIDDIPLADMDSRRTYDALDDSDEDIPDVLHGITRSLSTSKTRMLIRALTRKELEEVDSAGPSRLARGSSPDPVTPRDDTPDGANTPQIKHYRGGVLSSLLKLQNAPQYDYLEHSRNDSDTLSSAPRTGTTTVSGASSGANTPRKSPKWYNQKNHSQDTLAGLIEASAILSAHAGAKSPQKNRPGRPGIGKRSHSGRILESAWNKISGKPLEDEIRIRVHLAETLSRQKYLLKICWALMSYGAPTHRLEEYMRMSARVLEIDGQFLYMPGCMIISFDDVETHTTEVKLVKMNSTQGVDLGKLKDAHEIYKEVVHDVVGVEEATQRLDNLTSRAKKHSVWLRILVYGLASASVGPFAFEARLIDTPICFLLGAILGVLQLVLASRSELFTNVFEVSAAVVTSFLARAFGSIRGGDLFCFSAAAQSAIALILPGYLVLCASLELQSRSIIAGSVRMVYAIIYSLFLGYGITVGTALYGLLDSNASSATTCTNPTGTYYKWIFVPIFTLCLCIINQAKWRQVPVMVGIAMVGYIVNFFGSKKFPSSPQVSNTLGAFAVGLQGNLYSRWHHGLAAAAILPAIFVQVPSGLAASGSLLSGISTADDITNTTTYANGTSKINYNSTSVGFSKRFITTVPMVAQYGVNNPNDIVFNVAYSMIQIAIGITVGLSLSALVAYPFGKRRSGLFSF